MKKTVLCMIAALGIGMGLVAQTENKKLPPAKSWELIQGSVPYTFDAKAKVVVLDMSKVQFTNINVEPAVRMLQQYACDHNYTAEHGENEEEVAQPWEYKPKMPENLSKLYIQLDSESDCLMVDFWSLGNLSRTSPRYAKNMFAGTWSNEVDCTLEFSKTAPYLCTFELVFGVDFIPIEVDFTTGKSGLNDLITLQPASAQSGPLDELPDFLKTEYRDVKPYVAHTFLLETPDPYYNPYSKWIYNNTATMSCINSAPDRKQPFYGVWFMYEGANGTSMMLDIPKGAKGRARGALLLLSRG